MAKRQHINIDQEANFDLRPSPEAELAIQEAIETVKLSMPKSDELEQNPVEDLPIPENKTGDPRVAAIMGDGDEHTKMRISRLHIPPPLAPQPGSTDLPLNAAMKVAERRQKERAKQMRSNPAAWKDQVHYIECQDSDCLGPGIWFEGAPDGELKSDRWWSSYHVKGSYWIPNNPPHCQVCEANLKIRRPLKVAFISRGAPGPDQRRVGITLNPRHVRTITREEYDSIYKNPAEQSA